LLSAVVVYDDVASAVVDVTAVIDVDSAVVDVLSVGNSEKRVTIS